MRPCSGDRRRRRRDHRPVQAIAHEVGEGQVRSGGVERRVTHQPRAPIGEAVHLEPRQIRSWCPGSRRTSLVGRHEVGERDLRAVEGWAAWLVEPVEPPGELLADARERFAGEVAHRHARRHADDRAGARAGRLGVPVGRVLRLGVDDHHQHGLDLLVVQLRQHAPAAEDALVAGVDPLDGPIRGGQRLDDGAGADVVREAAVEQVEVRPGRASR